MSQTDYTMLHDVPAVMAAIGRGDRVEVSDPRTGDRWDVHSGWMDADIAACINRGRQFRIASPSRQAMGSQVVPKDVHTEHCCIRHGCKYGKEDVCTVITGKRAQSYPCEQCDYDREAISQVVSDGDVLVMVREFFSPRHNGTEARMRAAASALLARRPAQTERDVRAWMQEMKLSGDRIEYWVCVGHGREHGEYLSVRVSAIRGRTEYEVAEWNHMLGHGPEPDILAYDTDVPPAPAGASTHAAQASSWPTRGQLCEDLIACGDELEISLTHREVGYIADRIHARLTAAGGRDGEGS